MEEYKKDDRGRSKAKRLTQTDPHTKVDSSTWTPPEPEDAGVKTGARPLVKRLYKKGGKVVGKHEGKESLKHAGRKPRKAGGRTDKLTPDSLINRDVRTANEVREGTKHVGAFKKGGKAHKFGGGPIGQNPISSQNQAMAKAAGMMKKGGKVHKKWGGKSTGVETDFHPSTYGEEKVNYSDKDNDAVSNLAKYGSMRGNPTASPDYPERKSGGKATRHPDEAQDKKLMHKVLKPKAFKSNGGPADDPWAYTIVDSSGRNTMPSTSSWAEKKAKPVPLGSGQKMTPDDPWYNFQPSVNGNKRGGKVMHHDDCTCKMCGGGRAMKYSGGGIFSGDSKKKVPGDVGGRQAHAKGGSTIRSQFNDAFRDARNQGLDTFEFNGKMYNTKMAPAAKAPAPNYMQPNAAYRPGQIQSSELAAPAPTEMSADQQRGMMGRQPQMSTQHGLFMGRPDQAGIVFSRDVPDQNAQPVYHSGDSMPEMTLRDLGEKRGGRTHHAKGGRTKGKTNVNIIIGAGHGQPQPPMGMMGGAPMPNAPVNPQRLPPAPQGGMPQGGAPMPPMPPQGMPPMPRKSGGRTSYPIDTGAGGGEARLDKIKAYGLKPSKRK